MLQGRLFQRVVPFEAAQATCVVYITQLTTATTTSLGWEGGGDKKSDRGTYCTFQGLK